MVCDLYPLSLHVQTLSHLSDITCLSLLISAHLSLSTTQSFGCVGLLTYTLKLSPHSVKSLLSVELCVHLSVLFYPLQQWSNSCLNNVYSCVCCEGVLY